MVYGASARGAGARASAARPPCGPGSGRRGGAGDGQGLGVGRAHRVGEGGAGLGEGPPEGPGTRCSRSMRIRRAVGVQLGLAPRVGSSRRLVLLAPCQIEPARRSRLGAGDVQGVRDSLEVAHGGHDLPPAPAGDLGIGDADDAGELGWETPRLCMVAFSQWAARDSASATDGGATAQSPGPMRSKGCKEEGRPGHVPLPGGQRSRATRSSQGALTAGRRRGSRRG